jgi:hypothetical protein
MPKFDLLKKKTKNKKSIGNHFYRSNRSGYRSVYQKNDCTKLFVWKFEFER